MEIGVDVTDANGMKHDDKGLFSGYSGSAAPHGSSVGNGNGNGNGKHVSPYFGGHAGGGSSSHHAYGGGTASHTPHPTQKPPFRLPQVKTQGPAKQEARYVDNAGRTHDTRVDRITNQPVSREMENLINALYRGEDVPMREIERVPEIAREEDLADAYCRLDKYMHPERYAHKTEKINDVYKRFSAPTVDHTTNEALKPGESYQVKQGKEIWLVTGLPGSGKSTSFVSPLSKQHQARVVDSDAIKENMPGFCNGLGAPNVHEQSKSINDRILAESLSRGDNIIYPVLGYNADYVGAQIDSFRRKGYKVNLILNELPYSQSLARCLERRLATGRNIPLSMFKKVGDRPSEAYETLKKKVDTFEKHTGDGITTKLVEKGTNDLPPVERRPRVATFHGHPLQDLVGYKHDGYGNMHFEQGHGQGHGHGHGHWHGHGHGISPKDFGKEVKPKPDFAKEFQVDKPKKPLYWPSSWLDSFKKHGQGFGHDADADADTRVSVCPEYDKFGNIVSFSSRKSPAFDIMDIPESFDGEIEGAETAKDLARFFYLED